MTPHRLAPLALALALTALPLAGCISFGAKPPPSLLNLTATSALAVGAAQQAPSASTITIATPAVPQEIASLRVPVHATATTIAYLKDALWVEPPNRLFGRLLGDTITARTGRVVVGTRMLADPGATMNGDLRNFGVDAASSSAVVTYDAALTRQSGGPLEKRRFEARVPVAAVEPGAVGIALNQAANQVAGEVADWVGR